ncbi:MAG: hypothetical protein JXN59_09615 [Anaerolineae bacterium]|nr:hypothetical protein [Anaerolineae bacterium]
MTALFGGSALNCIFGAALLIGLLYALFLIFFQGVGEAFDLGDIEIFGQEIDLGGLVDASSHDLDLDADHGSEVSGVSMLAISGFTTAFGAFGLATATLLNAPPLLSLLAAAVGGVVIGGLAQLFFIQVLSQSTSSNIQLQTIKGATARVIVPIPEGGLGQIALVLSGQRMTLSARASAENAIPRSTAVIVDSVRDGVAYVSIDTEAVE